MKTTLDLPDDLMRAIKMRAAQEDRKLKNLVTELLRRGLAASTQPAGKVSHRVKLPFVHCAHDARPDEEMAPDRVSEALLKEEAVGAYA